MNERMAARLNEKDELLLSIGKIIRIFYRQKVYFLRRKGYAV